MKNSGNKFRIKAILLIAIFLISIKVNCQDTDYQKVAIEKIEVSDFSANGLILDIGGGGEGVIGQLKGNQVISVDISKQELVDAPSKNLKIVMDARDLKFIDNSFNTVVIFYTMMYINGADHQKVLNEVYRVLKPGGKLMIWDVNLPALDKESPEHIGYSFTFILPDRTIETGYGVRKQSKKQDIQYYTDQALKSGFKVTGSSETENSFFLELQKQGSGDI